MNIRPIFKRHFHVEILKEDNAVYLMSEKRHFALTGRLYVELASLLNGRRTEEEIIRELRADFDEDLVRETLSHMRKKGYVTDAHEGLPESTAAFWDLQNIDAKQAREQLQHTKVSIRNFSGVDAGPFVEMLGRLGVSVSEEADLTVVLVDDYLQEELREFNRQALKSGHHWLLAKPAGAVSWFGPVFVPNETACWQCLEHRIKGNREVESAVQQITNAPSPFPVSRAFLPTTLQTALSIAATQTFRWIVERDSLEFKGKIATLDLITLDTQQHVVTRRPQCPFCSSEKDAGIREPFPIVLQPREKTFTEDGGHRICSPAETLKKYQHLISPITGVVSELKPVFSDGGGLVTIYMGAHKISDRYKNLDELRYFLRNKATGKGKSRVQCRASAFSEAIERYSALYQGNEFTIKKSLNQLGDSGINLEDYMLFSEAQYANRSGRNHIYGGHQSVPERLDPDREIEWSPVWSLNQNKYKYFPTAVCYLMYPQSSRGTYFVPESNGLAAGNVLEEAILQGFFEVVERDAVSIWWYNRLKMPGVDLDSFCDPYFDALQDYYKSVGRNIWVLDVTNDFGVPTFVAFSRTTSGEKEDIIFGYGTHFDARIGISRALTEMNQFIYLLADGRLSNYSGGDRGHFIKKWWDTAMVEKQTYLIPDETAGRKTPSDYTKTWSNDLLDDIERCIDIAKGLGLEFLVHDMTRPDIGFSVVRVIVPGCRLLRARFAPGRLFEVPVKMGWLDAPLKESELNPEFIWI